MPTFECARCNDCFTKKKAEAHLMGRCTSGVTCVDCNMVFDLTTIKAHTSCISETDKYAGKWLAKQKENLPPKKPNTATPFVPPLPYSFDDSDGDSDIAIPTQSPISAPKAAAIPPPVINLVFADDARQKQEEKLAKVTALQKTAKASKDGSAKNGATDHCKANETSVEKKEIGKHEQITSSDIAMDNVENVTSKEERRKAKKARKEAEAVQAAQAADASEECCDSAEHKKQKKEKAKKEKSENGKEVCNGAAGCVTNGVHESSVNKKRKHVADASPEIVLNGASSTEVPTRKSKKSDSELKHTESASIEAKKEKKEKKQKKHRVEDAVNV